MKHTEQCLAAQRAVKEWKEKWPNHCMRCSGAGLRTWKENQSPLGSGLYWPETFEELCGCTEQCSCPRCGGLNLQWSENEHNAEDPCIHCGWKWGKNPGDAMDEVECFCGMEEYDW